MALDIYTWLAQRLHRVDPHRASLVPWISLKEQFGYDYGRLDNFRRVFKTTLHQVQAVYPEARFSLNEQGMSLQHSRPPVLRRFLQVK